jgi:hypothetical protein
MPSKCVLWVQQVSIQPSIRYWAVDVRDVQPNSGHSVNAISARNCPSKGHDFCLPASFFEPAQS